MRENRGEVINRILLTLSVKKYPMSASGFFRQGNYAKRGTAYTALKSLENKGLVYSYIEERRPGTKGSLRRMYSITARGNWFARDIQLRTSRARRPTPPRFREVEVLHCPKFF